jgi:ribonuclease Z
MLLLSSTNPAEPPAPDVDPSIDYYPNTEELGPEEMRVIALGTGLPTPLTPKQKSAAWLVELGNGDKFVFDIGTGSVENLFGLAVDFHAVNKVFVSHLHTDHVGDLDALWVGGWLSGRYQPLHVYGPSSTDEKYGTKYFVEHLKEAYGWDNVTRTGTLPVQGGILVAHEFDYTLENEVIYEENGVKIRTIPAIHSYDGSVSYILEWKGMKFVYGGDSYPNKWFIEHAAGADIAIHECIYTAEGMNDFYGWNNMKQATYVSSYIHTPPAAFGKIMSEVKPRMAVAYHFIQLPHLLQENIEAVRSTYDGPLSMAIDLTVYNVTKDNIVIRSAVTPELHYPSRPSKAYGTAERAEPINMSDFPNSGKWKGYTPPPMPE